MPSAFASRRISRRRCVSQRAGGAGATPVTSAPPQTCTRGAPGCRSLARDLEWLHMEAGDPPVAAAVDLCIQVRLLEDQRNRHDQITFAGGQMRLATSEGYLIVTIPL